MLTGKELRAERLRRGRMSQEKFAAALGFGGVRSLQRWESAEVVPADVETLIRQWLTDHPVGADQRAGPLAPFPDSVLLDELLRRAVEREHRSASG